jgi:hypothetical protein
MSSASEELLNGDHQRGQGDSESAPQGVGADAVTASEPAEQFGLHWRFHASMWGSIWNP